MLDSGDLLEYQFSEDDDDDDDGEADGPLLLMKPSSFMSPTKEALASLSPVDPVGLASDSRYREIQKLLHKSPRRRRIDETRRVSFQGILPKEDRERYQIELGRRTGVTWNRVAFMERTWDVIRRYGTQSVMKVGFNQHIMRKVLGKLISSTESDDLTESVTEDSADNYHLTRKQPVMRAEKGLKRLKSRVGSKTRNQIVIKSKASAVVVSLAKRSHPNENGRGIGWGRKRKTDTTCYWLA